MSRSQRARTETEKEEKMTGAGELKSRQPFISAAHERLGIELSAVETKTDELTKRLDLCLRQTPEKETTPSMQPPGNTETPLADSLNQYGNRMSAVAQKLDTLLNHIEL